MRAMKRLGRLLDPPKRGKGRVDSADGFRVIAILLVMWFHIWQQSWLSPTLRVGGRYLTLEPQVRTGYMMVDLMLLLSGFLLFLPYARHRVRGDALPGLKEYFIKRGLRILPSYWLCIAVILFAFALPGGEFSSPGQMWRDLISHLTFTHIYSYETYVATRLNAALWTLAVEVQFYLLLPLLGRLFERYPLPAYLGMTAAAFCYRGLFVPRTPDMSLWFNHLPAMLDVYANGMMAALIYVSFEERLSNGRFAGDRFTAAFFTAAALASAFAVFAITRAQVTTASRLGIENGQMYWRYPLSLAGAAFLLSAGLGARWLRFLLSNRLVRFLSAISYNAYMWHQYLAVRLKQWHIPPYTAEMPQMAGEQPWQRQYTWLCFLAALLLAALLTYAFEKPVYRLGERLLLGKRGKKQA